MDIARLHGCAGAENEDRGGRANCADDFFGPGGAPLDAGTVDPDGDAAGFEHLGHMHRGRAVDTRIAHEAMPLYAIRDVGGHLLLP